MMLENVAEAQAELSSVSALGRDHPETLRVRYAIHAAECAWETAYAVSVRLVEAFPDEPAVWVWRAYAARRMPGGGLEKALEALLPAAEQFPEEWIFPFNLACYLCQLGRLDEARRLYSKSLSLGGTDVRALALTDPDLEPLRRELSGEC